MGIAAPETSGRNVLLSTRLMAEMAGAHSNLRTITERSGPDVVLHAGGELDARNEATWRRLLREAAAAVSPPSTLVIDASGLDFMGCCAFAVLAEEAQRCRRRGVDLRLVSKEPTIARTVAACGLKRLLPVHDSVDDALSGD
ncbi:anti-sigma factor antagonist [Mycobacterium sp.]|uniref:anti-sigma factor antagonist n=1 Tax=Mycobacterium sp. TaxID=1785 RepID=UPI00128210F2|nr:anti-sigma factor antagonist [Mycobacterium sp.]KAA8957641.1 MAG: anti-sigma factor antagonist [Mycobacterium sp.]